VFSLFQNLNIAKVRIEVDAHGRYQEFGLIDNTWVPYEELGPLSRQKAADNAALRKVRTTAPPKSGEATTAQPSGVEHVPSQQGHGESSKEEGSEDQPEDD
jgi:hypothetical protein